jgi:hypothetical protein
VALCREGALVRAPGRHPGGVRVAGVHLSFFTSCSLRAPLKRLRIALARSARPAAAKDRDPRGAPLSVDLHG